MPRKFQRAHTQKKEKKTRKRTFTYILSLKHRIAIIIIKKKNTGDIKRSIQSNKFSWNKAMKRKKKNSETKVTHFFFTVKLFSGWQAYIWESKFSRNRNFAGES